MRTVWSGPVLSLAEPEKAEQLGKQINTNKPKWKGERELSLLNEKTNKSKRLKPEKAPPSHLFHFPLRQAYQLKVRRTHTDLGSGYGRSMSFPRDPRKRLLQF